MEVLQEKFISPIVSEVALEKHKVERRKNGDIAGRRGSYDYLQTTASLNTYRIVLIYESN